MKTVSEELAKFFGIPLELSQADKCWFCEMRNPDAPHKMRLIKTTTLHKSSNYWNRFEHEFVDVQIPLCRKCLGILEGGGFGFRSCLLSIPITIGSMIACWGVGGASLVVLTYLTDKLPENGFLGFISALIFFVVLALVIVSPFVTTFLINRKLSKKALEKDKEAYEIKKGKDIQEHPLIKFFAAQGFHVQFNNPGSYQKYKT